MTDSERIEQQILEKLNLEDIFDISFLKEITKPYSEISIEGLQEKVSQLVLEKNKVKIDQLMKENKEMREKIRLYERKKFISKKLPFLRKRNRFSFI